MKKLPDIPLCFVVSLKEIVDTHGQARGTLKQFKLRLT